MFSPLVAIARVALIAVALFAASTISAKTAWKPISPEELAEKAPRLEQEAPAEVLLWSVEVDDRSFPQERSTSQYIRYKIYAPDKVDALTRVSEVASTAAGYRKEINARLVLPDGTVREFGKEAMKERTLEAAATSSGFMGWLTTGGGPSVRERFLAVSGIEAGAILEYQFAWTDHGPNAVSAFVGQRDEIPVRSFRYHALISKRDDWLNQTFVSSASAKISRDDKQRTLTITAENLPSMASEPMAGPVTDRALTILSCYEVFDKVLDPRSGKVAIPDTIDRTASPWTVYATIVNWYEQDRGFPTARVKKLAAELTGGLANETAKARAIHRHVEKLAQLYRTRPAPNFREREEIRSLDTLADIEKHPNVVIERDDFLWLAIALYRSAGLECRTVMLPDGRLTRFKRSYVSPVFLPNAAARVRVDGTWTFSAPHVANAPAFGLLSWEQEGHVGLLALARQEEFIPVPPAAAEESVVGGVGNLTLDADGQLTGEVSRTFTGHVARGLRGDLRQETNLEKRNKLAAERFGFDHKKVELEVTRIGGLEDTDEKLELVAKLQWPGYATRTKERLVVQPAVFRAEAKPPFSAATRRYPIHFPYRWQEVDDVRIALPAEFQPEAPSSPASIPGIALDYKISVGLDRPRNVLWMKRHFVSNVIDFPLDAYAQLKAWYDVVNRSDHHELVFVRKSAASATAER